MSEIYESLEELEIENSSNGITTFDGINHNVEELLEKMMDDDFYYGYLGKVALSSSSLKTLLKSPKLYAKSLVEKDVETQPLRDGKMFHWSLLEPEKFEGIEIVDVNQGILTNTHLPLRRLLQKVGVARYTPLKKKILQLTLRMNC